MSEGYLFALDGEESVFLVLGAVFRLTGPAGAGLVTRLVHRRDGD